MSTTQDLRGELTSFSIEMFTEVCISCGIPFAIPKNYKDRLKVTHDTFYCPNGHSQFYPAETEAEKLKKEVVKKDGELAQLTSAKIQIENQLDKANEKLNKVAQGQCPCCDKTYKHLANHMSRKHPDLKTNK